MSEIPFVDRLGDAIDNAVAIPEQAPRIRRRRRRRVAVAALAVLALGATGTTIAALVGDREEQALGLVSCHRTADLDGEADLIAADGEAPVAACAALWTGRGEEPPPLVACQPNGDVPIVIPGGVQGCRRVGLEPLPASMAAAQPKVARLSRDVAAIEESADCLPPAELRARVQQLLARSGWEGWRATVHGGDGGPCGWVRRAGGSSHLSLGSALRADLGEVQVTTGPPRSLREQLYDEGAINTRLFEAGGERCLTLPELRDLARRELGETGRPVSFRVAPLPSDVGMFPESRQRNYDRGCAVPDGAYPVYPASGVVGVEVSVVQR